MTGKSKLNIKQSKNSFECIAFTALIILVCFVVFYLVKGMDFTNKINMIIPAADNAINKIYNVLVITVVLFTILITSVFAFIWLF